MNQKTNKKEVATENLYTPNCIRTFTGKYVNVFEPTVDMICIEDIAHALSNQCRFGGHLPNYYSVAEHSIYCSEIATDGNKLEALLHDAPEAYILDMPTPIKQHLTNYKEIEDNLMKVIAEKFGLSYPFSDIVKWADRTMLHFEWEGLMIESIDINQLPSFRYFGQSNKQIEEIFLKTFNKLITNN